MAPTTPNSRSNGNANTPSEVAGGENVDYKINEWTVMFFFAADSDLSPLVVSQLKAIKEAGYDKTTDVLVYFDSSERGVPTRLYNVNNTRKSNSPDETEIGDGEDPYVRNFARDDVAPDDLDSNAEALDALKYFVSYGRKHHKAKHYMLFLVGHGMIVGNDAFLPDESPRSAVTLPQLADALGDFKKSLDPKVETFELLALHSCSMSALEVAYELKGTAKYMMASEGISYVGSWPYRQLLKKTFKTVRDARKDAKEAGLSEPVYDVDTLIQKLYFLSLYNSTDFMLSGFSSDLSLCNLNSEILKDATGDFVNLVEELKVGLDDEVAEELIVLAHRESQSFWNENYTDLYDFCHCLQISCDKRLERYKKEPAIAVSKGALLTSNEASLVTAPKSELLGSLSLACGDMIKSLKQNKDDPFSRLVIFSEHFGPKYQYSHGLSVFFPWTRPVEDANGTVMKNYSQYQITKDFKPEAKDASKDQSWLSFIEKYWQNTKRDSRMKEYEQEMSLTNVRWPKFVELHGAAANRVGSLEGKAAGSYEGKAAGSVGAACGCPSIKNYNGFSVSPAAALAFLEDSEKVRIPERRRAKRPADYQRST